MAVTTPAALHMIVPDYGIDQIIGVFSGSATLAAPAPSPGFTTQTNTHGHNFGDNCYFQGIFSYDGGTTWNDFSSQIPNYAAPNIQLQTVQVEADTDSTNLYVVMTNWYDTSHSSGTQRTIQYKVYLMAKNT